MTFNDLLASTDRLTLDLLGEPVTYTPTEGDPVEVQGVFDLVYVKVEAGEAGVSSSGPSVFLLLSDLPSDPSDDNATITAGGVDYGIREAEPDGKGGVRLYLHRT